MRLPSGYPEAGVFVWRAGDGRGFVPHRQTAFFSRPHKWPAMNRFARASLALLPTVGPGKARRGAFDRLPFDCATIRLNRFLAPLLRTSGHFLQASLSYYSVLTQILKNIKNPFNGEFIEILSALSNSEYTTSKFGCIPPPLIACGPSQRTARRRPGLGYRQHLARPPMSGPPCACFGNADQRHQPDAEHQSEPAAFGHPARTCTLRRQTGLQGHAPAFDIARPRRPPAFGTARPARGSSGRLFRQATSGRPPLCRAADVDALFHRAGVRPDRRPCPPPIMTTRCR